MKKYIKRFVSWYKQKLIENETTFTEEGLIPAYVFFFILFDELELRLK